ncbi:hypothetical protein IMCC3317_45220 [Kordia antarctica]|uniref:Uncharacterized protein n=1 Tax=Kordia antarctica TaxID=1218801 RepID=A0A7L4ZRG8_9FLAO|nr:hypothetical protein [Kordia antarctica]QHI39121.1 hypothetical protein IMCC3317_45220 [Kordia antarctica]
MKKIKVVSFFLVAFLFCSYTAVAQEEEEDVLTITGTFTGMEKGMFAFTFKDVDGEESTIDFDKISPEAKQLFDLTNKEMIGSKFVVTYSNVNEEEEGADGEIEYVSVKTILTLKKL